MTNALLLQGFAIAAPMPRLAPVTSAVLLVNITSPFF